MKITFLRDGKGGGHIFADKVYVGLVYGPVTGIEVLAGQYHITLHGQAGLWVDVISSQTAEEFLAEEEVNYED